MIPFLRSQRFIIMIVKITSRVVVSHADVILIVRVFISSFLLYSVLSKDLRSCVHHFSSIKLVLKGVKQYRIEKSVNVYVNELGKRLISISCKLRLFSMVAQFQLVFSTSF